MYQVLVIFCLTAVAGLLNGCGCGVAVNAPTTKAAWVGVHMSTVTLDGIGEPRP